MDWNRYKTLLKTAGEKSLALNTRTQLALQQPAEMQKVMACLEDGTIDRGDAEQVTRALMKLVAAMPEYHDLLAFQRANSKEYSEMYRELAGASEAEYAKYQELIQELAVEMSARTMFEMLAASGLVVDKRSS
jgi:hypothetical protein